jgi:hypothetical protein
MLVGKKVLFFRAGNIDAKLAPETECVNDPLLTNMCLKVYVHVKFQRPVLH